MEAWGRASDSGMGDLGSCHPSHFVGVGEERRGQKKKKSRAPAEGIPAPPEVTEVRGELV